MESAIFYSSKISGADAYMPFCQKRPDQPKDNIVQVYPNPAANYLIVRYNGRVTGTIQFRIFDITGKKVYDKTANTVIKTNNQYTLDLRNLLAGSYVLEVYNSKSVDQTKFVVVRN